MATNCNELAMVLANLTRFKDIFTLLFIYLYININFVEKSEKTVESKCSADSYITSTK